MLLYFAGSMIMNEPTDECIIDFWARGNLKKLPLSSLNPRFIEAATILRDSCIEKELCREMLVKDFNRLFSQSGLPLAPAYASVYLNSKYINGFADEKIGEYYNSFGWEYQSNQKIANDHLGIELLFLTRMMDNYLKSENDLSFYKTRKAIIQFLDLYLFSWIPDWNKDVLSQAKTLCYKGISTLLYACTEDIYDILASSGEVRENA